MWRLWGRVVAHEQRAGAVPLVTQPQRCNGTPLQRHGDGVLLSLVVVPHLEDHQVGVDHLVDETVFVCDATRPRSADAVL